MYEIIVVLFGLVVWWSEAITCWFYPTDTKDTVDPDDFGVRDYDTKSYYMEPRCYT